MNSNAFCQPLAFSHEVRTGQFTKVWQENRPLFLTRLEGRVVGYEDFCPHRGAPLSQGKVWGGREVECPYHGWRFNLETGENTFVPVKNACRPCTLKPIPLLEAYDLVWHQADKTAVLPALSGQKPLLFKTGSIQARLVNVAENFLEGSHTHFVHEGYIRSAQPKRQAMAATFRPQPNGFTVHYQPEPPKGLLTKVLPRKFRTLRPIASYVHPHVTVLSYLDTSGHCLARFEGILKTEQTATRFFARIFLDLGGLTPWVSGLASYFFGKIIRQDQHILEIQDQNLKWFPQATFVSDDTDAVGQQLFAWMHNPAQIKTEPFTFEVLW
ncbi:MAG: Rieske 2Fe-2S domain-containing protein [Bacteroidetes Order II. Incertae sedis bacterium]|nr:Rieske 2Fe-2S domain-containing protein [Bacteroidetes Order II. bacterium]